MNKKILLFLSIFPYYDTLRAQSPLLTSENEESHQLLLSQEKTQENPLVTVMGIGNYRHAGINSHLFAQGISVRKGQETNFNVRDGLFHSRLAKLIDFQKSDVYEHELLQRLIEKAGLTKPFIQALQVTSTPETPLRRSMSFPSTRFKEASESASQISSPIVMIPHALWHIEGRMKETQKIKEGLETTLQAGKLLILPSSDQYSNGVSLMLSDLNTQYPRQIIIAAPDETGNDSLFSKKFSLLVKAEGTRESAASLTGTVANLLHQNPDLKIQDIHKILFETATPLSSKSVEGILNIEEVTKKLAQRNDLPPPYSSVVKEKNSTPHQ